MARSASGGGVIRRMIPAIVIGLAGCAVLVWLGVWQVQRLAWKTEILDHIETMLAADPVAVPADPDPARDRYRRVIEAGSVEPGELHVYTSVPGRGVGYRVIVPFRLADGRLILLDRGFVPIGEKDAPRRLGPLRVRGSLAWPDETDGYTDAPDREKNIWFARDVELMSAALGTLPVMLVTEASDDPAAPFAMPVGVDISNDHLQYAITWFGLAIAWAGMTVYWLWRIGRRTD